MLQPITRWLGQRMVEPRLNCRRVFFAAFLALVTSSPVASEEFL